ncbi:MAG: hypothetical protein IKH85_05495 [Methanobrevibacter sp.]|uniref:hypothetical protein n=1 Tax=Methanobrevibacter sp. TaxID=66852 RepID=UPI0025F26A6A|nr:hypothetical protein [Methanobrevibacter sp.]MBR6993517.1 hypothetical protein [Methanobrevibacter sp.]
MNIRKAVAGDLSKIMSIYKISQDFMIESGNPNQWGHFYPSEDLIRQDIKKEVCHVISDDEDIHAVFALFNGSEPTYEYIENGEWLNDDEYVTVHRIASDGKLRGIFKFTIDYCKSISDNIRIDTHNNNLIMQKQIEKNGFEKCGTIYVADGSPRIAYQWSKN